jgi:hypothetical protein
MTGSTSGQLLLLADKWWINQVTAVADDWINLNSGIAAA